MAKKVSRGSIFNQSVRTSIPRTSFDLSHVNKFSCKPGYLYPVFCKRVVPGDSFGFQDEVLLRTMPLVTPAFIDLDVDLRYFYIPNRLVWKNFNDFITNPDSGIVPPYIRFVSNNGGVGIGSLYDFLGYASSDLVGNYQRNLSSLRLRAYNLIWNTWYRDQNLQNEVPVLDSDGDTGENLDNYSLLRCSWKRDYFTSCLPDAQFGDASSAALEVFYDRDGDQLGYFQNADGQRQYGASLELAGGSLSQYGVLRATPSGGSATNVDYDPNGTLKALMRVSELREMTAIQRFRELLMTAGRRIKEFTRSQFGVDVPDHRAQYPEFLGGGSIPVQIGEVPQTSASESDSPQGTLAGRGISANSILVPNFFVPEFGFIMAVMVVRPKSDYFQGLDRELTHMDYYDYYNPLFEHIGEQEVMKSEIFGCSEEKDGLFGYQSRNADYKYYNNEIHGQMANMSGLSLGSWHLARFFNLAPSLNSSFLECDPDLHRVFATSDSGFDPFVVQLRHGIASSRPMSEFSTPGLIG